MTSHVGARVSDRRSAGLRSVKTIVGTKPGREVPLRQNVWTEKFRRAVVNVSGQLLVHEGVPAQALNEIVDEVAVANG